MNSDDWWVLLGQTFHYSSHREFIFVYGVKVCSDVIVLHVAGQLSQHHLLKKLLFPSIFSCLLCCRLIDHRCVGLFLDSIFSYSDTFSWSSHTPFQFLPHLSPILDSKILQNICLYSPCTIFLLPFSLGPTPIKLLSTEKAFIQVTRGLYVARVHRTFWALTLPGQPEALITVDHPLFLEAPSSRGFGCTTFFWFSFHLTGHSLSVSFASSSSSS